MSRSYNLPTPPFSSDEILTKLENYKGCLDTSKNHRHRRYNGLQCFIEDYEAINSSIQMYNSKSTIFLATLYTSTRLYPEFVKDSFAGDKELHNRAELLAKQKHVLFNHDLGYDVDKDNDNLIEDVISLNLNQKDWSCAYYDIIDDIRHNSTIVNIFDDYYIKHYYKIAKEKLIEIAAEKANTTHILDTKLRKLKMENQELVEKLALITSIPRDSTGNRELTLSNDSIEHIVRDVTGNLKKYMMLYYIISIYTYIKDIIKRIWRWLAGLGVWEIFSNALEYFGFIQTAWSAIRFIAPYLGIII